MSDLKAYAVQETDENTGGIFYARHAIVARKRGANEYAGGEIGYVSCCRAPWADQYAPGPCPKLVMIEHGWWFECHGCGVKMQCDAADYEEEGEEGQNDPDRYIERGSAVYCSTECRTRYRAEQAQRKRLERRAIRELAALLLTKLPTVCPITIRGKSNWRPHAYVAKQPDGSWATQQCVVSFEWPGMKIGPGTYRFDKVGEAPHVSICNGDLEAWSAWRSPAPLHRDHLTTERDEPMTNYSKARADFEYLESIVELDDQVELDSQREGLMRNPTKAHAAMMYEQAIRLWLGEHGACHHDDPKVADIAKDYGICDCQNPEPKSGVALVSEGCPIHAIA